MKNINLIYNDNGYLKEQYENDSFYIAKEEDKAVIVNATFPAFLVGSVRAYLQFKGGGDVVQCGSINLNQNSATLKIDAKYLTYNFLKIGFEVVTSTKEIRFEPVKLEVDEFVNVSGGSAVHGYTVTVKAGRVITLDPDEEAYVKNTGTEKDAIFEFGIPKGKKGESGYTPVKGEDYFTDEEVEQFKQEIEEDFLHALNGTFEHHKIVWTDSTHFTDNGEELEIKGAYKSGDEFNHYTTHGAYRISIDETNKSNDETLLESLEEVILLVGKEQWNEEDGIYEPIYQTLIYNGEIWSRVVGEDWTKITFNDIDVLKEKVNELQTSMSQAQEDIISLSDKIADDIDPILKNLAEQLEDKSGSIVNSSSGETIHLTDSVDAKLKGLSVYGKTTQNETPTPETPIILDNVGDDGNVDLVINGKNIFDVFNAEYIDDKAYISVSEDGVLKVSNKVSATYQYAKCVIRNIQSVENIYCSFVAKNGTSEGSPLIRLRFANTITGEVKTVQDFVPVVDVWNKYTATVYVTEEILAKYNVLQFFIYSNNSSTRLDKDASYVEMKDIMISTIDAEYEPYISNSMSVITPNGLKGIPVTSDGNYTDSNGQQWVCDEIDFKRGVYVQRIYKVDNTLLTYRSGLTETDNALFVCSGKTSMLRYLPGVSKVTNICSHCIAKPNTNSGAQAVLTSGVCVSSYATPTVADNTVWYLVLPKTIADSTESLQAFFASQEQAGTPFEWYYILETPIETPLTDEQISAYKQLQTYKLETIITNEDEAYMKVDYVADTKSYIDNKFAELQAMLLEG